MMMNSIGSPNYIAYIRRQTGFGWCLYTCNIHRRHPGGGGYVPVVAGGAFDDKLVEAQKWARAKLRELEEEMAQ